MGRKGRPRRRREGGDDGGLGREARLGAGGGVAG